MKANDTRAKGMVFNQKAGEYIQELEAELVELRESRKADCVEFFHWWWNHDGTNTEQGYDDWVALIQDKGE